ncbi:MAG: homoserine O-acetyltransferase MetX [Acidimicrobiia bacterium]
MSDPSIPVTGAWRPGDPSGRRQFATFFDDAPLALEAGGHIGPVTVAYETWGELNATGTNAVLVLHALTGDSHAAGTVEPGHVSPGWWDGLIGPGRGVDTDRWFAVCPNVLGGCQGTTGPSSLTPDGAPYGSRFPVVTPRDQVEVERALADHLGIARWGAVIGGSMGGMRALEWAITYPARVERLVAIGVGAAATAEQIALTAVQNGAIALDPYFNGGNYYDLHEGPWRGLSVARASGQIAYRTELELDARFGRRPQSDENPLTDGRYAVESYLQHHGAKIARRFDANTYVTLSRSMDHHDVGRGRGGISAALARISAPTTVVAIDSDRLYPPRLQSELARGISGAELATITSAHGHDAFLLEYDQLNPILEKALRA